MTVAGSAGHLAIREAQESDTENVVSLWHAAGVSRSWNDPYRDFAFARRDAHSAILVGEVASQIVASAMVGEDGHRGWVYYVAVDPAQQGRGHGAAIMEAAESWLLARGVWKVQLLVRGDNSAVVRFYEAQGYRDTKTVCLQKVIEPDR